jgi:hypothetical protein
MRPSLRGTPCTPALWQLEDTMHRDVPLPGNLPPRFDEYHLYLESLPRKAKHARLGRSSGRHSPSTARRESVGKACKASLTVP